MPAANSGIRRLTEASPPLPPRHASLQLCLHGTTTAPSDTEVATELFRLFYRCCGSEGLGVGLDEFTLRQRVVEFNRLNQSMLGPEDLENHTVHVSRRTRIFRICTRMIVEDV